MKRFLATASVLIAAVALGAPVASQAAPVSHSVANAAMDTPQALVSGLITSLNSATPDFASLVTASGTTTATASGLKTKVSVTGLTTAAGVTSAAMTVTNTSVAAASLVYCQVMGYAGGGNPRATNIIPAAGSFSFTIQNTHASAALDATVPVACMVYN